MSRFRKCVVFFLLLALSASLAPAWGEEDPPDARLATEEEVYETAVGLFEYSWMPKDVLVTVLPEGEGLWNLEVSALSGRGSLAVMQIDGDNGELVVYYRLAAWEMPALDGLAFEPWSPEGREAEALWDGWAVDAYAAFRGDFAPDADLFWTAELGDGCRLYAFGYYGDVTNILMARIPEDPDNPPQVLGYVDLGFNWNVRYDGYVSFSEAFDAAVDACLEKWPDLPPGHLVLNEYWFLVQDTAMYYDETPEEPLSPLWLVYLEDQRTDPGCSCYDPSVEFVFYPVLVNPETGEVVEIREPEASRNG